MEGGGTLKAMMKVLTPEKLKELIDVNRQADVLHKDKKYSPQLLMYLDNKTKDQSLNKEVLTLEDARKILETLRIEAEDDPTIDIGFYGPPDTIVGSVSQAADTALRAQLNPKEVGAEPLELDLGREAYAKQVRRLAKERADADAAIKRQLSDSEQGKKVCEEELARVREDLLRVGNQRDALSREIDGNSQQIREKIAEIEQQASELERLRNQLSELTQQLRGQTLAGQTNAELMSQISELQPKVRSLEESINELVLANQALSSENAAKQAQIDIQTHDITRLIGASIESSRRITEQGEQTDLLSGQIAELSQQRDLEEKRKVDLERQKQAQLQTYLGEAERLEGLIGAFQEEATTHTELLRRISIIDRLLLFYRLSKNVLGETPQGQALQEQISKAEASLRDLQTNLASKGRECDQLLVKITELEGTIRLLQQQIGTGIGQLPAILGQLRALTGQADTTSRQIQELQRTSVKTEELDTKIQTLTEGLDRISREITTLQGEIKATFATIQQSITAGNAEITLAMRTQSAADLEALLSGQKSQTAEIASKLSEQQQQLSQQTSELERLRSEFAALNRISERQLEINGRIHKILEECFRGKHAAEEQARSSQLLVSKLGTQLAGLQAQREEVENQKRIAEQDVQRLRDTVRIESQLALQAIQSSERSRQAEARLQEQLRAEQERGNPQRIAALETALAQEQARLRQAEAQKQQAETQKQQAEAQKQAAQEAAQQTKILLAGNQAAAQQAQASQRLAQESLRTAMVGSEERRIAAEAARAAELQRIQAQFEDQCVTRENTAADRARQAAQVEIDQLNARLVVIEQLRAAERTAADIRTAQQVNVVQQFERMQAQRIRQGADLEIARITERLNRAVADVAARDVTIAARDNQIIDLQANLAAQAARDLARQGQLNAQAADIVRLQAILDWHRTPVFNLVEPAAIPAGGIVAGTQITFNVTNFEDRAVFGSGRTVAFFHYGVRTEYVDITDNSNKVYTVQVGLQNVGAFNF